jgi:hypothetical protein
MPMPNNMVGHGISYLLTKLYKIEQKYVQNLQNMFIFSYKYR